MKLSSIYLFAAWAIVCLFFAGPVAAHAEELDEGVIAIAEITRDAPVDFQQDIAPILRRHCVACHNATTAEGSLVLESSEKIHAGGDSGAAVVPDQPMESLILLRASGRLDSLMPPEDNDVEAAPLSPEELGLLKLWIEQGAHGGSGADAEIKWQPLPPGVNPIYSVALSSDGQFAACGRANQIFLYHLPTKASLGRLTDPSLLGEGESTAGAAVQRDGAAAQRDGAAAQRDIVQSLAFNDDATLLASGGFQAVRLWRKPRDVRRLTIDIDSAAVTAMAVSRDGAWLATAAGEHRIKLWDPRTGELKATCEGHQDIVASLCFSTDGARLVSGSRDGSIRAWRAADGVEIGRVETGQPVSAVVLLAGDAKLASGGGDAKIRIWNIQSTDAAQIAEEDSQNDAPRPEITLTLEREIEGHTEPVTTLAVLPTDEARFVSGGRDGGVRLWQIDGKQIRQFDHGGPVTAVAVRPDGKRLASAGENNLAKLWNTDDGKMLAEMTGDLRADRAADEVDRSLRTARERVGDRNNDVAEAEKRLTQEQEAVGKAAETLAPLEKQFTEKSLAANQAADAKAAADRLVAESTQSASAAEAAQAAAEKAVAEAEAQAKAADERAAQSQAEAEKNAEDKSLAEAKTSAEEAAKKAHARLEAARAVKATAEQTVVQAAALAKQFTDEAAALAKPLEEAQAALQQAETAKTVAENALEAARAVAARAADAVPQAKAAVAKAEEIVKQFEAELESARQAAAARRQPVLCVTFSPDNLRLATGGADHVVHTWSAENGAPFDTFDGHAAPIVGLVHHETGAIVSAAEDGKAIVWEVHPAWTFERKIGDQADASAAAFVDRVTALDFSPDGRLLATGGGEPSRSGELKIWDLESGELLQSFPEAHSDAVLGVAFSPDGDRLASCGADKFVKVFDMADGELVRTLEGHTHHVLDVGWKRDGKLVASCGADNVIKIWNVLTGDQQRTIQGFGKEVTSVAFIGETAETISSSGDATVRRHRTDNGSAVRTFGGSQDFVYSAAANQDGEVVVGGGQESVLRVWNGANGQVVTQFDPPAAD